MELLEGIGIGVAAGSKPKPSEELLKKRPLDPRAWHCKTVEEYRLFKFSTGYHDHSENGKDDAIGKLTC